MNYIKFLFGKLGIDEAIIYVILGRGGSVITGLVTILLISKYLNAEYQGYYYTFSSVMALQVFFELGFGTVLVQFASHEMGGLSFKSGVVDGDLISKCRLLSLIRLTIKWYSFIAVLVVFIVSTVGFYFFSKTLLSNINVGGVNWEYPWISLVTLTSISMLFSSVIAIAEGCGFVISINKMRVKQVVLSGLFAWICLISGNGLYATSAMAFSVITIGGWWLYRNFLHVIMDSFFTQNKEYKISWLKEIFPMQWRIALSWMSGYFLFQLLTPLAFKSYGPVFAGRLGLSLTICTLMVNLSMAWINTKIPYWGKLIAKNKRKELNESYGVSFKNSCVFFVLMMLAANFFLFLLNFFGIELANRVLSVNSFFLLCLCMLGQHVVACQATYVRTHKVECYTKLSVVSGLCMFLAMYGASVLFSCDFMVPVYLFITWGLFVPWSVFVFRKFKQSKITNSLIGNG